MDGGHFLGDFWSNYKNHLTTQAPYIAHQGIYTKPNFDEREFNKPFFDLEVKKNDIAPNVNIQTLNESFKLKDLVKAKSNAATIIKVANVSYFIMKYFYPKTIEKILLSLNKTISKGKASVSMVYLSFLLNMKLSFPTLTGIITSFTKSKFVIFFSKMFKFFFNTFRSVSYKGDKVTVSVSSSFVDELNQVLKADAKGESLFLNKINYYYFSLGFYNKLFTYIDEYINSNINIEELVIREIQPIRTRSMNILRKVGLLKTFSGVIDSEKFKVPNISGIYGAIEFSGRPYCLVYGPGYSPKYLSVRYLLGQVNVEETLPLSPSKRILNKMLTKEKVSLENKMTTLKTDTITHIVQKNNRDVKMLSHDVKVSNLKIIKVVKTPKILQNVPVVDPVSKSIFKGLGIFIEDKEGFFIANTDFFLNRDNLGKFYLVEDKTTFNNCSTYTLKFISNDNHDCALIINEYFN